MREEKIAMLEKEIDSFDKELKVLEEDYESGDASKFKDSKIKIIRIQKRILGLLK